MGDENNAPDVTRYDYPLSTERPDLLCAKNKTHFTDITMKNLRDGKLADDDLRISGRALLMQAKIAESSGRSQLGANFRRAAEMVNLDDEKLLYFYNKMRPSSPDKDEMIKMIRFLQENNAPLCAELVREAVGEYERRNLFKKAAPADHGNKTS